MKVNKYHYLVQGIKQINKKITNLSYLQTKQKQINLDNYSIQYQFNSITYKLTLQHYEQLMKIFNFINLSQISDDFQQYMRLPGQILGKRASKIVISKSNKYCMKLIEQNDMKKIQDIFQQLSQKYYKAKDTMKQNINTNHFTDSLHNNNCLIAIYCIFIVQYTISSNIKLTDRVILMPNVRGQFNSVIKTYDIKGHLQSRIIDEEDFKDFKFGKDQNFVVSSQLKLIKQNINKNQLNNMIKRLQQNINFLASKDLIDYSLLLSIQKSQQPNSSLQSQKQCLAYQSLHITENIILKYAIIDYFQQYNDKKKMQNKFFSLFKKSVSSVQPQIYSKRLIEFLKKYLLD